MCSLSLTVCCRHSVVGVVYNSMGYKETVSTAAHHSMQRAVEGVISSTGYAEGGEVRAVSTCTTFSVGASISLVQWVITDARHDSTANAYHTTVPCMSGRYVNVCHVLVFSCACVCTCTSLVILDVVTLCLLHHLALTELLVCQVCHARSTPLPRPGNWSVQSEFYLMC